MSGVFKTIIYIPLLPEGGIRDDGHVLRKVLEFEMKGKRKRGRLKKTGKMQVEKESKSVGLEEEDAMNRARWRVGVGEISVRVG